MTHTKIERSIGQIMASLERTASARDAEHDRRLASDPEYKRQHDLEVEIKRLKADGETIREETRKVDLLASLGVPRKDLSLIIEGNLKPTKAIKAVSSFYSSPRTLLVLSGAKGCGKTLAASWCVVEGCPPSREAVARYEGQRALYDLERMIPGHGLHEPRPPAKIPGRFIDVARLSRISRYKDEEIGPLESAAILVIDDLGMEFADAKGSFLATLDGLINSRYAEQLRTVITTNLPAQEFKARYGERIADRIREAGSFVGLGGEKSLRSAA